MLGHFKLIPLVLAINFAAGGIYAFATQNTDADSIPAYKTSTLPGYNVTGIIFDANDTDPTVVDSVTFHVAPAHGSVQANRVEIQTRPNGDWIVCSLAQAAPPTQVATCTFESLAAEDVTSLNINVK